MDTGRNICELPMIMAFQRKSTSGKDVFAVSIDDIVDHEKIASFEIPENQAEQFALELEALSASIRSLLHVGKIEYDRTK